MSAKYSLILFANILYTSMNACNAITLTIYLQCNELSTATLQSRPDTTKQSEADLEFLATVVDSYNTGYLVIHEVSHCNRRLSDITGVHSEYVVSFAECRSTVARHVAVSWIASLVANMDLQNVSQFRTTLLNIQNVQNKPAAYTRINISSCVLISAVQFATTTD